MADQVLAQPRPAPRPRSPEVRAKSFGILLTAVLVAFACAALWFWFFVASNSPARPEMTGNLLRAGWGGGLVALRERFTKEMGPVPAWSPEISEAGRVYRAIWY